MPRKRTIPWETQLLIFLDYRRLKKVYPTAKLHGIARSTVSGIVDEFKESGFSSTPRPDLSPAILSLAQEHHLNEVMDMLRHAPSLELQNPTEQLRGGLQPDEELGEPAELKTELIDPLPMPEELNWHLHGSETGELIQDVKRAVGDFSRQCLRLWQDIRSDLEVSCGLPVRAYRSPQQRGPEPQIFHGLVDRTYRMLFDASARSSGPPDDWPGWNLVENDPSSLRAGETEAAAGGPERHQMVKLGVESFLHGKFLDYIKRPAELTRLYHDLLYAKKIVEEALRAVTSAEVCRKVCPACPYPEALLTLDHDDAQDELAEDGSSESE